MNYLIVGASGIGSALANVLSKNHRVFATYHTRPKQDADNISFHPYNVLEDDLINKEFLPDVLDGLAYCVGSIILKPFSRVQEKELLHDYQLQVMGGIKTIQACLPLLRNSEHPSIVLFSSVAVQTGFPFHSIVSAHKGAIEGLTKALSAELAPKIRVNCIAPSLTATPLSNSIINTPEKMESAAQKHPLKRIGDPKDIASMANYLLSKESGWITGQIIHVDGGVGNIKS